MAIPGHVMLHHKVYQNKLIQNKPRQKVGVFLCNKIKRVSKKQETGNKKQETRDKEQWTRNNGQEKTKVKKQMQQLQHKQFATMPVGRQVWNELPSILIRDTYVLLGAGFTTIGNDSKNDKIRPWFKL